MRNRTIQYHLIQWTDPTTGISVSINAGVSAAMERKLTCEQLYAHLTAAVLDEMDRRIKGLNKVLSVPVPE